MKISDIVLAAAVFLPGAWFCRLYLSGQGKSRARAAIKCAPTAGCFLLALYALGSGGVNALFQGLMCAGLLVCVFADWVIEFKLMPGAVLFGCAHLCFIAAFALKSGGSASWTCLILLAGALAGLFLYAQKKGKSSLPAAPFAAYIALICLMAALAVNCGALFGIGALLFVASDTLLGLRLFGKISFPHSGTAVMVSYYLALYLFALGSLALR